MMNLAICVFGILAVSSACCSAFVTVATKPVCRPVATLSVRASHDAADHHHQKMMASGLSRFFGVFGAVAALTFAPMITPASADITSDGTWMMIQRMGGIYGI